LQQAKPRLKSRQEKKEPEVTSGFKVEQVEKSLHDLEKNRADRKQRQIEEEEGERQYQEKMKKLDDMIAKQKAKKAAAEAAKHNG